MRAIVDCNSFYCSCEKVFRPELDQRPVVVLSNNDGCVIARCDEAKRLGIAMGGPYFQVKSLIQEKGVQVFSSNYSLYGDMSRRVMDILKEIVGEDHVEVYSVDEAFLSLYHYSKDQLEELAETIKRTIKEWTGIDVSIGVAPTKTLAKVANRLAKKNKEATGCLVVLDTEEKVTSALQATAVRDVWGVGSRYAGKLATLGVLTAWDLRQLAEEWVRKHLGGVVGVRLIRELKGEEAVEMKDQLDKKKMIATTRMFGRTVTELSDIKEAVATYTARAAEKLRRQQGAAGMVSVFLISQEKIEADHFRHGPTVSSYVILPQPTSLTPALITPAVHMAEQLFRQGKGYKKAGVVLSGIVPDDSIQGDLFLPGRSIGRYLMEMVDNINFSMRNDAVKFAAAGTRRNWKMQQSFHSQRYTTRWEELYEISC
ncbi:MAG TPA: Y-family DNA polymerase [Chitinophagaceae bacterium]